MSLAELRANRGGAQPPREGSAGVATAATGITPEPGDGQTPADEPRGVSQVITPSGLEIYYQAAPKRLYRVRQLKQTEDESGVSYTSDPDSPWVEVASVSTILQVLEKGGLSWWGMKVGVQGAVALASGGHVDLDDVHPDCLDEVSTQVIELLKQHKLTVNHVKDKAADRGTNVHAALEQFAETGTIPDPEFFPESERGYVQGLVAFLNDAHPTTHFSELTVASEDGWAGRFDWVVNLDFAGKVVTKTYPKKTDVRREVSDTWLIDLKTSKGVYPSYKLQTAAYAHGFWECGYGPVRHAGVLRVTEDGRYELVESDATYDEFLSVLDVYHAVKRLT